MFFWDTQRLGGGVIHGHIFEQLKCFAFLSLYTFTNNCMVVNDLTFLTLYKFL